MSRRVVPIRRNDVPAGDRVATFSRSRNIEPGIRRPVWAVATGSLDRPSGSV